MLNNVVNQINKILPSPSLSSIATTSTGDNLGSDDKLISSRMDSSTTTHLYNVGQPEKFIRYPVSSSINQKLYGNVDEVQLKKSSTQMYYNQFDEFGIIVLKKFIIIFMVFFSSDINNEVLHLNRTYKPDNEISQVKQARS
jgi:hypothetical protein